MNKKVLLFLANGFEELEAAAFTDVMGWSRVEGIEKVDLVTVGLHKEIKGTWNLIVKPEKQLSEIDLNEFDALAIPGGFEEAGFYEDAFDQRAVEMIKEFNNAGKPIATICVGALPVANAGILKNRNATTYDLTEGHRRHQLCSFGAKVLDEFIVKDKNIITSTGPATALNVAFGLLEILTSKENRELVEKAMRFEK